jgi:spore germination protein YaaH
MKNHNLLTGCLLSMVISSGITFGQESTNIHYLHAQKYVDNSITNTKNAIETIELQPRSNELSHIVFGYLPYWMKNYNDSIQYDLLSHVALFDFPISSDGRLDNLRGWPWVDVINSAHSAGTKVIVTLSHNVYGSSVWYNLITNDALKNNLFNQIKEDFLSNNVDGINFDVMYSISNSNDGYFIQFLGDLRDSISKDFPDTELSYSGPAVNWTGYDLDGIVSKLDYVYIQAYAYSWSGSSNAGPSAPLYAPDGGKCIDWTYNDYITWVTNNPKKLILGVPYYGNKWKTVDGVANSQTLEHFGAILYKDAILEMETYGRSWDDVSKTPWYGWFDTDWYQVWTEDTMSLKAKYDYAIDKGFGGVGIWALNYDLGRNELWELLDKTFSTVATNVRPIEITSLTVYPNPAGNYIIINSKNGLPKRISIIDILGNVVASIKPESYPFKVDISNLARGMYFVNVEGSGTKASRFIKGKD